MIRWRAWLLEIAVALGVVVVWTAAFWMLTLCLRNIIAALVALGGAA